MARPECFKRYHGCVLQNDYWDVIADLDCAHDLASCLWGAFRQAAAGSDEEESVEITEADDELYTALRGVGGRAAEAGPEERKRQLRDVLYEHRAEAHDFGKRVRDRGEDMSLDKGLEGDLNKFLARVLREVR